MAKWTGTRCRRCTLDSQRGRENLPRSFEVSSLARRRKKEAEQGRRIRANVSQEGYDGHRSRQAEPEGDVDLVRAIPRNVNSAKVVLMLVFLQGCRQAGLGRPQGQVQGLRRAVVAQDRPHRLLPPVAASGFSPSFRVPPSDNPAPSPLIPLPPLYTAEQCRHFYFRRRRSGEPKQQPRKQFPSPANSKQQITSVDSNCHISYISCPSFQGNPSVFLAVGLDNTPNGELAAAAPPSFPTVPPADSEMLNLEALRAILGKIAGGTNGWGTTAPGMGEGEDPCRRQIGRAHV